MTQVVFHEGGDEVVAVVVAVLHAQRERGARLPAAVVEHLRVKLLRKKLVRGTLIDEDRARKRPLRDQDTGVVFCPGLLVRPQVAAKRFLPPGAAHGRGDRRKGRYRAVLTGVAQGSHQRAMTAHRVPGDALRVLASLELTQYELRQFPGDVAVHAVVL